MERELRDALSSLNQTQIEGVLRQRGIKWSFNSPTGSHYGRVWERVICMIRKILSLVLQQQRLDDDGLHTVCLMIQMIWNPWLPIISCCWRESYPCHQNSLINMTCMLRGGGNQWNTCRTSSGSGGSVNICHCYKREKNGINSKPISSKETSSSWIPLHHMAHGRLQGSWRHSKILVRSVHLQTKNSVIERPLSFACYTSRQVSKLGLGIGIFMNVLTTLTFVTYGACALIIMCMFLGFFVCLLFVYGSWIFTYGNCPVCVPLRLGTIFCQCVFCPVGGTPM